MTNAKSTKRALWSSTVALILCFAMLLGTTYAWFTDSVTSANNIIQSGNLDVELYYQVEGQTDWTKVTADTNVFMPNALWEPGHTEVVKLKVVNEGTLALKYNLGVNIADETGSVNVNGAEFKLSDHIKYGIVDGAKTFASRDEAIAAVDASATALKIANNSGTKVLTVDDANTTDEKENEKIVTMVVYMPTSVGNEANYAKGAAVPTIHLGINLFATQVEAESDSFDANYDKDAIVYVKDAEEAQAALDNAAAGAIIQLLPGVNYGTLYLRPVAGGAPTKEVDWIGNNYRYETYSLYENLTILGADGATVDAIEIEGGTYYNTAHSQSDIYPIMLSLVELKNVVIDGVTFTGMGGYDPQGHGNVINLSGNNIKVDGLTLKNCVLENETNNARLIYKTESTTHVHTYAYDGETFTFSPTMKNITVTGCTFNGGYMGLELRETENLTITNNEFNVADRNILIPVNTGCTYSGNITITGNVSNNAQERFVRADGMGDAVVVIKDNTLNNYMGADADYIKVTNGNNVTVVNNTLASIGVKDTAAAQKALDNAVAGTTIQLAAGVNYGTLVFRQNASSTVVDITTAGGDAPGNEKYRRIEDLTIIGAEGAVVDQIDFQVGWIDGSGASFVDIKNLTIQGVTFSGEKTAINLEGAKGSSLGIDGLTLVGCKMKDADGNNRFVFQQITGYKALNDKTTNEYVMTTGIRNLTITDCEVEGAYMVIESRAMENLTITNNVFKGIKERDMLITSDTTYYPNVTYTGAITITGNTSIAGEERFVRGSLNNSDAVVVIKDNTIIDYMGADDDYIKVTGGNNVTIENNTKN